MCNILRTTVCAAAFMIAVATFAGGSSDLVTVLSIERTSLSSYVLVVKPHPSPNALYSDPYMGGCSTFTVSGSYSNFWRFFPWRPFPKWIDSTGHRKAVDYLITAKASEQPIRLGWMGGGFKAANAESPCKVKSKALELYSDEEGQVQVISYHDPV